MSNKISTDIERKIIDDFAKEIKERSVPADPPKMTVIDFRTDRQTRYERLVKLVPIRLLRFRKDNGRIASDIISHEKLNGILDETEEDTQELIRKFLKEKDEENNIKLIKSIEHSGQNEPAIITCDGFLINGNRRKMAIEELYKKTNEDKYTWMRVVILPGKGEDGGVPTIRDIEKLENRYQLQSDGKSEYTNFDRAISIQRKIDFGIKLDEQLRDDPTNVGLGDKEFKKVVQEYEDKFLGPLECIDRYLEQLNRNGLYDNISEGRSDREGRWYSFVEYYKLFKQLQDDKRRTELGVEEDEVGDIEDVAFKVIRKKDFPENLKLMQVIRTIPRILKTKEAKNELMKIGTNTVELTKGELSPDDDLKTIDKKWGNNNGPLIISRVKKAIQIVIKEREQETPFTLLVDALKKLNHENMDPISLDLSKLKQALDLTKQIQARANELEKEFWTIEKGSDKFKIRKNK